MKDNFDDILKRKLEEQHFPVDDTHRLEMIELLNGKKRRGVLPIWWLGSLVIVASLAGYFLLTEQDSQQPAHPFQDGEIQKNSPPTESQPTQAIAHHQSSDINSKAINSQTSTSTESTNALTTGNQELNKRSEAIQNSKNQTTQRTVSKSQQTANPAARTITESAIQLNPGVEVESGSPKPNSNYLVEGDALTSYVIVSDAVAVTIEDPGVYAGPEPELKIQDESGWNLFPQERIARNTEFVETLDISGIDYVSNSGMAKIMPLTVFRNELFLFGEAGVGMVLPSLPVYSSGWKFRGGAGIGYSLSPKIQFSFSAGYLLQVGGFDFERTSTLSQPSFGARSSFNSLTPDKLHFVYSRIGMQYRVHRHLFGVHGGMQLLYGAQGTIVTQVQDQLIPGESVLSNYGWVKTDGLRKLHWTADLSYGFQLTPRLVATAGTDFYFSAFTESDAALLADGYTWDGSFATLNPFITLNYLLYGR